MIGMKATALLMLGLHALAIFVAMVLLPRWMIVGMPALEWLDYQGASSTSNDGSERGGSEHNDSEGVYVDSDDPIIKPQSCLCVVGHELRTYMATPLASQTGVTIHET